MGMVSFYIRMQASTCEDQVMGMTQDQPINPNSSS